MAADESDLAVLRARFDAEIRRIDQMFSERDTQFHQSIEAAQRALDKAETEQRRAHDAANEWRDAMNDREKRFTTTESHDLLESQVDYLRRAMDTSQGRRTAWVAAAGIIATMLAIGVGQIIRQGITAADVSQQIQREAPWNRDKEQVERRITVLEAQVQHNQILIAKLQSDLQKIVITAKKGG